MASPAASSSASPSAPDPTPPRSPAPSGRALVLGGGGSTGHAWLVGVLAGLADAGLEVREADVTVGTSAGSTVAAQLTAARPGELHAPAVAPPPAGARPATGPRPAGPPTSEVQAHIDRITALAAAVRDAADMRRRLGALALERNAASDGTWQPRWRATVAARLPGARWPARTLLIPAVDAETGEPVVFDNRSGVDLVDAVAASCSSGLPYRVGDRWYLDGPERPVLGVADVEAQDLAVSVGADPGGDHHGLGHHPTPDPGLAVGRVQEHIRERRAGQGPVAERGDLLVQAGADPRDLGPGDPGVGAQRLDQVIDLAGGDPVQVGLHHHREQRLVHPTTPLQQRGEERPGAQLGDPQVQIARGGGQRPRPGPVALGGPLGGALPGVPRRSPRSPRRRSALGTGARSQP